ncbi:hypothetical protein C5F52_02665 [Limnohabitans sp. TS-CS-82]|jgi:hypothetical protein|uniref:DUF6794 domain-containing protein n=1 Tax=Limnohabitans sp. TS-CS-82 TaxID=2094193 RepID=UPI000CF26585|nr:DUF6794 domain-containing protein [Limnohabitans sp. TS-CS-82]PQA84918.1 hypothetical protein C5F52_02665 [Limnohabitans sp. TS-CS-82]
MKRLLNLLFGISTKKRSQLPEIAASDMPATVAEAISLMQDILPQHVQDDIRAMKSEDLGRLHRSLGMWVRNNFQLWSKDSEIRKEIGTVCADNASEVVVCAFWEKLQERDGLTETVKS